VTTVLAGKEKNLLLAAHDLDPAGGPFHRTTQSFSRRILLPFRGFQLEYQARFHEQFAGFSRPTGA
jgi:hypothetical protein